MIEKLQHKYALSRQGAKDMIKACICVAIANMVLMMPAGVLYMSIKDLLNNELTKDRIPFYVIASVVILILIAVTNFIQYNATFLTTYRESGVRRSFGNCRFPISEKRTLRILRQILWVTVR